MPAMGAPDRGDLPSVAGGREPIVDCGANAPALHRRVAWAGVASDQQQHPLGVNERIFERAINGLPGALEIMAVQVDDPVGLDVARAQPAIPA